MQCAWIDKWCDYNQKMYVLNSKIQMKFIWIKIRIFESAIRIYNKWRISKKSGFIPSLGKLLIVSCQICYVHNYCPEYRVQGDFLITNRKNTHTHTKKRTYFAQPRVGHCHQCKIEKIEYRGEIDLFIRTRWYVNYCQRAYYYCWPKFGNTSKKNLDNFKCL